MDTFVITCPWCKEPSSFEMSLNDISINEKNRDLYLNKIKNNEDDRYILKCKNLFCLAPFEAVVCKERDNAIFLQERLIGNVWFSPRRFRLRKNLAGDLYENYFSVLFNRRDIERKTELTFSEFIDLDMITRFLFGTTLRQKLHTSIFEAWVTPEKTFWIPIDPFYPESDKFITQIQDPQCMSCRKIFKIQEKAFLENLKKNIYCEYSDFCPLGTNCILVTGIEDEKKWNRCLKCLEFREDNCMCYHSDLSIIKSITEQFEKGKFDQDRPFVKQCWAGNKEIASPIIVHNHIVAVIISGPFITADSTQTVDKLIHKEIEYRRENLLNPESCLKENKSELEKELRELKNIDNKKINIRITNLPDREIDAIFKGLKIDIKHITEIVNNKYVHIRNLIENAYRREITSFLTNKLLEECEFSDFLVHLLDRMKQFWAFENVCLLMGSQSDDNLTVFATDSEVLKKEDSSITIEKPEHLKHEFGIRGIFLILEEEYTSDEYAEWKKFVNKLIEIYSKLGNNKQKQVFVVLVFTGSRHYVYCFYGRDENYYSVLSHYDNKIKFPKVRLSEQCKEEILLTCQSVSERLHSFWQVDDQELSYRMLSHSLRNPIKRMRGGSGILKMRVHNDVNLDLQKTYPEIYDAIMTTLTSLRYGSDIVNYELDKLSFAGNIEGWLKRADESNCNLKKILSELKPQYIFFSKQIIDSYKRSNWIFKINKNLQYKIIGNEEVITLAIRNVLDNAAKYSYNNRDIIVEIRENGYPNCIDLIVINRGVPIKDDELEKIWNKNYRGEHAKKRQVKAEEGTGYGLYIVKRILEKVNKEVEKPYSISRREISTSNRPEDEITTTLTFKKSQEIISDDFDTIRGR